MEVPNIKLRVFIQPSWCKSHKEVDITVPNDNLNAIKKKLLTAARASSQNLDNFIFTIQYFGLDMPIVNEDDFYLMLTDTLQDPEKLVAISIKKIVKRRVKKQFAFDEIGTMNPTLDNDGDVVLNRPNDKIYDGSTEVFCAFCRTSNRNKAAIRDLGPFYGPFKNKQKAFYTHELCAIWTPDVYLDSKTNKMKNLQKEVKRCNKMFCSYCGGLGGGLGCKEKSCKRTYHFKCLLDDKIDCQLDYNQFTMLCPEHAEKDDDVDVENLFCKVCGKGDNEDRLIICEKCIKGYHTFCLDPPLDAVPEDKWYCGSCVRQDMRSEHKNQINEHEEHEEHEEEDGHNESDNESQGI